MVRRLSRAHPLSTVAQPPTLYAQHSTHARQMINTYSSAPAQANGKNTRASHARYQHCIHARQMVARSSAPAQHCLHGTNTHSSAPAQRCIHARQMVRTAAQVRPLSTVKVRTSARVHPLSTTPTLRQMVSVAFSCLDQAQNEQKEPDFQSFFKGKRRF